ncbi:hypothetical protein OPV22_001498 [Ensete ventricosum]|uniref:Uncharacterized protein n=1 Tax=Ensete ventricosum TaxID=4639 RepID=A0AAV8RVM1_ENSVE|nr:hypothetical protein OPV22_001498 [Ensete ventricosum]
MGVPRTLRPGTWDHLMPRDPSISYHQIQERISNRIYKEDSPVCHGKESCRCRVVSDLGCLPTSGNGAFTEAHRPTLPPRLGRSAMRALYSHDCEPWKVGEEEKARSDCEGSDVRGRLSSLCEPGIALDPLEFPCSRPFHRTLVVACTPRDVSAKKAGFSCRSPLRLSRRKGCFFPIQAPSFDIYVMS